MTDPALTIRRATREDIAALAPLISELGYARTEEEVATVFDRWNGDDDFVLLAESGGEIVGSITLHTLRVLHRTDPVGRVTSLIVAQAARGRGIGRALVEAAAGEMRAAGCAILEVTSNTRFAPAHDFYRHLGAKQTSLRFHWDL